MTDPRNRQVNAMTRRRQFLAALAASGLLLALSFAPPALAQSPEELLRSGVAGERWDGFMESRNPSAAGTVAAINDRRRAVYQQRAAEQGVPVEEVGKVYALEIINRAPPGSWILRPNGEWIQK